MLCRATSFERPHGLAILLVVLFAAACSPEVERAGPGNENSGNDAISERLADAEDRPAKPALTEWQDRRLADGRPSVILVVIDTLRADAVSAYGFVEDTTPHLDALAARGIRYEHAYAPAPWTVSSHVSLFTGLRVDQHGVGLDGLSVMPDSLDTLAEDFQEAGYATAGFAENALIHREFGFERGFDRLESPSLVEGLDARVHGEAIRPFGLLDRVRSWNRARDKSQPYFLFVNLFDPHDPYQVRDSNPWVPDHVSRGELEFITSKYVVPFSLCDALPIKEHLALLRGLYLGDVASADAKLGELLEILEKGDEATPRIVVATSDHGEHLGENRLMGHQFSVRNVALHIPMIVSGLSEGRAVVIKKPVELRSVRSSLLCWALGRSCSYSLPVSESSDAPAEKNAPPVFSLYSDSVTGMPESVLAHFGMSRETERPSKARAKCGDGDPVHGEMVSMIRYPMKITWFSQNDMVLHDLRWDSAERADQMRLQPERAAALRQEVEEFVRKNVLDRETSDAPELSEEAVRRLKKLGYLQ